MLVVKAKKDFSLNGKNYIQDDEIKGLNIATIKKLNEKGFIYPLSYRDLVIIERKINNEFKREV